MSDVEGVAQDQLRSLVERIERLQSEKKDIGADIKDVYAEAKGNGFDTKVLRKVIAIRKQDQNERAEQEAVLDLYCRALGMGVQDRLPFGDEDLRTRRRDRRAETSAPSTATVQLCDEGGKPLHAPVDFETLATAVEIVKKGGRAKRAAMPDAPVPA